MDKRLKMTYLMDIYSDLLTEKQRGILNLYFNEDNTLTEIADMEQVSRQAAFDLIKRAQNILASYDEKLGLFDKYLANTEALNKIEELVMQNKNEEAQKLIIELKENL